MNKQGEPEYRSQYGSRLQAGRSQQGQEIFLFPKTTRPALGLTQLPWSMGTEVVCRG